MAKRTTRKRPEPQLKESTKRLIDKLIKRGELPATVLEILKTDNQYGVAKTYIDKTYSDWELKKVIAMNRLEATGIVRSLVQAYFDKFIVPSQWEKSPVEELIQYILMKHAQNQRKEASILSTGGSMMTPEMSGVVDNGRSSHKYRPKQTKNGSLREIVTETMQNVDNTRIKKHGQGKK